jgi:trimeric autotransporter adhesin
VPLASFRTITRSTHHAGDGGPATSALLLRPQHAVTDSSGNIYISDTDNNAIRKVDNRGNITTIAGTGNCNYGGDLGKAVSATLCEPEGLAFDATDNLYYIADWGNGAVRKIDTTGTITRFAGNKTCADTATNVSFEGPFGLTFDANGYLHVSDHVCNRVTVILVGKSANPPISLFAGNGAAGSVGDGGLSGSAALNGPTHIAAGPDGAIYIADTGNNRVRKVIPSAPRDPRVSSFPNLPALSSTPPATYMSIGKVRTL